MIADTMVVCQLMGLPDTLYNVTTGNPYIQQELHAAVRLINEYIQIMYQERLVYTKTTSLRSDETAHDHIGLYMYKECMGS